MVYGPTALPRAAASCDTSTSAKPSAEAHACASCSVSSAIALTTTRTAGFLLLASSRMRRIAPPLPPTNTQSGAGRASSASGAAPCDDLHVIPAQLAAVFFQQVERLVLALDRVHRAVARAARQLERHRARARAHVPDRVARLHREPAAPTAQRTSSLVMGTLARVNMLSRKGS